MTHNPIIKQEQLGLFNQPEIGRTQQGVIQQGLNYHRVLPEQKLSRGELFQLRGSIMYVVDCRSHSWSWKVQLPSKDDEHPFQYRIDLNYRIGDPVPIVQQNVVDVERVLQQKLLAELRLAASSAQLDIYKQIGKRIASIISSHECFLDYGLELDNDIRITALLSDTDKSFVDELEQLTKARTIPRQISFSGTVPTEQAMYGFITEVNLQYQLVDEQRIRSIKELEEAARLVWDTHIHKVIRKISRKYSYQEMGDADVAINDALDEETFVDYGIRITSAVTRLRLDEASRKAAEEDEQLERGFEKDIKKQDHVKNTMLKDRMTLLANMHAQGESNLKEVLKYLDDKELEAAGVPLEMIQKLKDLDVLDRDTAEDVAKALLTSTLAAAATKQVPQEANELLLTILKHAQLPEKSTARDDEGKIEND